MLLRIFWEGACRSCTLQPSYKSSPQSQVPGHLTALPAKQPHCCSHPHIHALYCFPSKRTFFPSIILLLIYMTTERQWIPVQRHRPTKLCLGLMELNHWLVQFKVHHYHPPLWGGEEQPSFAASPDCKVEKITVHSTENVSFGSSYENAIHPVHSLYAPA